jgi:hypothetical protein
MLNKGLKPLSGFDWAENAEDELQQLELLKPTPNFNWADDVDENRDVGTGC